MATKRYYLNVPKDKVSYALRYGAHLEEESGRFYVEDDIPEMLEAFTSERPAKIALKQAGHSPLCPDCKARMIQRQGKESGKSFWGCSRYPACKRILNMEEAEWLSMRQFSPDFLHQKHPDRATVADYTRVAAKALKCLGPERFESWLFSPNVYLDSLKPVELLKTKPGIALVEVMIEHWDEM